jgi:hypothetical protein
MREELAYEAKGDNPPEGYRLLEAHEAVRSGDYVLKEASFSRVKSYQRQWCRIVDIGSDYEKGRSTKYARLANT